MGFGYVLLASYWTILVAELIGDKSIYTVASLSLRFRARIMLLGMFLAFAGKMLVAVLTGQLLVQIPAHWTAVLSTAIFFTSAVLIWFKKPREVSDPQEVTWPRAVFVPFAALFLTEWCDAGQITAVALTAQFHFPLATWLGGTLALMTKAGLAIALGVKLRHRIPERRLRALATASCCVLGSISFHQAFLR
ncbi:MAG: Ca2+/H+ antiporter, family [Pyrinomonadaceae bacterium]|jgi:putative Ca2+/H+ antiporter (TMEM165/GDT1 family)|nr:Ca2+/H+ antiporter, family [Pyrinomonadaceae bacterium]